MSVSFVALRGAFFKCDIPRGRSQRRWVYAIRRFLETYQGSSIPTRCELDDGSPAVVKMRGAGNGAESLIAELLVNRIVHAAGFPVPDAFPVVLTEGFPWDFGTDEFYDIVKKSFGLNLGLTWIPQARSLWPAELAELPEDFIAQIVTLDLVFANVDRCASSSNLVRDRAGQNWILDHGSCRFLQRSAEQWTAKLHPGHFLAGREDAFRPNLLRSVTRETLRTIVAEIPAEWLAEARLDRLAVEAQVIRCVWA